jgi:phosphatidylserine decarboxylase
MQKTELPLATEGFPFILFSAFATLVFSLLGWPIPALLCLLLTTFCTYFFRDPSRVLPEAANAIVCPADGKVILIDEIDDDRFLQTRVRKISIFMSVFDVHVNRIPLSGTGEHVRFSPGKFYAANKDQAVLHNEYCALTLSTPDQQRYVVVQIAGLIARRIVCRAEKGDQLQSGERFGMIRLGSRVDLYLPLSARITTKIGDRVRGGESVLGYLETPHNQDSVA